MVYNGHSYNGMNGTSHACPLFAAMQAEIDQRQNTRKGNVVGRLFSIWQTYKYGPYAAGQPFVFHDITQGNTGYQAVAGYDWASGIGSVDGLLVRRSRSYVKVPRNLNRCVAMYPSGRLHGTNGQSGAQRRRNALIGMDCELADNAKFRWTHRLSINRTDRNTLDANNRSERRGWYVSHYRG